MPVEIKELIIRAVATQDPTEPSAQDETPQADASSQALVEACVRQVLKILKRSKER